MLRVLAVVLLSSSIPFVSGCSLFFSTDDQRRVPPPSTPEIAIEPAAPTTIDDLRWALVTPSVGFGGDVEYDVEWFHGGESRATSATISHESTTRGDVWTVRVTPRVGDRRGEPAEVSVTVGNSLPAIETIGFSHYRPVTNDTLEAFPLATDADGDEVTFAYRWLRNGTIPVPSATTSTIPLGERGFVQNDTVTLEVVASDGVTGGAPRRSVALPVAAAATAWRPITPPRMRATGTRDILAHNGIALDPNDRRMVYLVEGAVWELPHDRPGDPARLFPEGPAPSEVNVMLENAGDDSLLAIDPQGGLFRLELVRGAERWTRLSAAEPVPIGEFSTLRHPSIFVDDARDRVVLFGGEADGVFVHPLSVTNGAWIELETPSPGPELLGAAWLHEPGADTAYLVGGALPNQSGSGRPWQEGTRAVWAFSLATPAWSRVEGADAPADIVWPATALDPESRTAYVLEGAADLDAGYDEGFVIDVDEVQNDVHAFDFATRAWRTLPNDGERLVPPRVRGTASWDRAERRILHTSGSDDDGVWRTDIVAVHPDGRREGVELIGRDLPYATLDPGSSAQDGGFVMVGGRRATGSWGGPVTDDVWAYEFNADRFRKLLPDADPMYGAPPPLAGMSTSSGRSAAFFGGQDGTGALVADAWQLITAPTRTYWMRVPMTGPSARRDASLLAHGNGTLLFGGADVAQTDAWRTGLGCPSSCTWTSMITAGATRPPSSARIGQASSGIIAVGVPSGGPVGVWVAQVAPGASWTQLTVPTAPGTSVAPIGSGLILAQVAQSLFLVLSGNRVWELRNDGGWSWTEVATANSAPSAAYDVPPNWQEWGIAAWDADRGRLVIFGGSRGNDVWELRYAP